MATYEQDGFPGRYGLDEVFFYQERDGGIKNCFDEIEPRLLKCLIGDISVEPTFVVFGDSHAFMLTNELDRTSMENAVSGFVIRSQDCILPGLVEIDDKAKIDQKLDSCANLMKALALFLSQQNLDTVVLLSRWTQRFFPVEGEIESLGMQYEDGQTEYEARYREYGFGSEGDKGKNILDAGFVFTDLLLQNSKNVVIFGPIPTFVKTSSEINFDRLNSNQLVGVPITQTYETFIKRHGYTVSLLKKLSIKNRVTYVDSSSFLCDGVLCFQQEGVPLYFDEDHLNNVGAARLAKEVMRNVK